MIPHENLRFGVSNIIGDHFITKLRVKYGIYEKILPFIKRNNIPYQRISHKTKVDKKGNVNSYDTFVCICTYGQLNHIKLIIRKDRLNKLKEEINQLSINW